MRMHTASTMIAFGFAMFVLPAWAQVVSAPGVNSPEIDVESLLAEPVPAVVAKVDDTPVTREDFMRQWSHNVRLCLLHTWKAPKLSEDDMKEFLEGVINEKILEILASRHGRPVTDEEVKSDFEASKAEFPREEFFQEYLKREKLDEAALLSMIRKRLVVAKFKLDMLSDVRITPADVRAEYDRLVKDGKLLRGSKTFDVYQILVAVKNREDMGEWDKARGRIEQARGRLLSGEDPAKVAEEMSDSPTVKADGGMNREVPVGHMGLEFDARVETLKIDELSEPFKTDAGWNIMKVTATHEPGAIPFSEVQQQISAMLIEQRRSDALLDIVKESRKKMKVEILYTPRPPSETKPQPAEK